MTLKEVYKKERNRIMSQMRRMKKRGYYWEKDILPNIPQKITRSSINRLKNITTEQLYKSARYVDKATGESLAGVVARDLENEVRAKKAAETRKKKEAPTYDVVARMVVEKYLSSIKEAGEISGVRKSAMEIIENFISKTVAENGYIATAKMLMTAQENGVDISPEIYYKATYASYFISELMRYLGASEEEITDTVNEIEIDEDFGEYY